MRQLILVAQLMVLVYGSFNSNANYQSQWNYESPDTVHITYGNVYSNGGSEIFGANSYFGGSFTDGSTNNYEDENRKKEKVLNSYGELIDFGDENHSNDRRTHGGFADIFGGTNRDFSSSHGSNFGGIEQYTDNYKSNYPDFGVGGNGYVGTYTDVIRSNGNQNDGGDGFYNMFREKKNYRGPQYLNDVQVTRSLDKSVPQAIRTNIAAHNGQYDKVYNGYNLKLGKERITDPYTSISYNVGEVQDINANGDFYSSNFGNGYNIQSNKNRANSGRDTFSRVVGIGKMYYGDGYTNMNVGAGSFKNNLNMDAINHHYNYNYHNKNNNDQSFQSQTNDYRNIGINDKQNSNRFNNVDIFKSQSKVENIGTTSYNKGLNINGQFMSDLETFKYGFMNGGSNIFNVPKTVHQGQSLANGNKGVYNNDGSQNVLKNNRYTSTNTINNGGRASSNKAQFRSNGFNNQGKLTNFEYSSLSTGVNDKDNGQSGQVRIHKHFYVHVPPPDLLKEETTARPVVARPSDTHYKIIFIKTPSQTSTMPVMIPMTPEKKEKTLVYVLVKKPEDSQTITIPTPAPTPPSNPEVHFITYKTKKEKQGDFSNLRSSFSGNGGLSEPSRKFQQENVNEYHKK